jgi:signal transduction histidine kinase
LSATVAGDSVLIRVRDTGRGIARDKLDEIFEPFVRVDTGYTRATEGTGLGLSISRDLARAMGGDLTATSGLGEGSTFTLSLPTRKP